MQLTRDLFAIAKFLFNVLWLSFRRLPMTSSRRRVRRRVQRRIDVVWTSWSDITFNVVTTSFFVYSRRTHDVVFRCLYDVYFLLISYLSYTSAFCISEFEHVLLYIDLRYICRIFPVHDRHIGLHYDMMFKKTDRLLNLEEFRNSEKAV